jgi:hypothetical protein
VTSTTQVPNLYASRAAVADATTNGLTTTSTFANIVATDIIVGGNNSSLTANLRTVNTNVGTYGSTAVVPQLTVDAKGRIIAVSNIAITFPAQTLISNTSEITANTVSGTPGLNLTTTGVTAGTYGGAINVPQITVDTKGRVTSITSVPVNSTLNTLNIGIPIGTIALWSGALSTIPDGWQICNGTNGTVNLRDKFVVGAGSLYNPGTTGGSADAALPSHTHTATSTSTFTGSALPTHSHGVADNGHVHGVGITAPGQIAHAATSSSVMGASSGIEAYKNYINSAVTGIAVVAQTAGTPSGTVVTSTTLSTEGVTASNRNLPPYYALYYIQKMSDAVSINNPINYMATVGNIIAGGNIVAASGNTSVSTTTGALVVRGGAGIAGNVFADKFYTSSGIFWSGNGAAYASGGGGSFTASASAPVSPALGSFWYKTTTDVLYEYINDGVTNYWIDIQTQTIASNTAGVSTFAGTVFGANITFTGSITGTVGYLIERANVVASAPPAVTNLDLITAPILYFTSNTTQNVTANIRGNSTTTLNSLLSIGQSTTFVIFVPNATAYYVNTVRVDNTVVTPYWQGGFAIAGGNANCIDIYTFAVLKTANATFKVFASQVKYQNLGP